MRIRVPDLFKYFVDVAGGLVALRRNRSRFILIGKGEAMRQQTLEYVAANNTPSELNLRNRKVSNFSEDLT